MRTVTRRARRGLTLFETMIAISILVVLGAVGFASLEGAIEMNDLLAKGDITTRSARVALDRLRRELALAYLTPNRQQNVSIPSYTTVFVGEDRNPDQAWFTTFAHQRLYRNSAECDQAEVSVWVDDAPRDGGPGEVLFHRESARVDELPDEDGRIWPLAYHVETFNLRYLNSRTFEWADEWDSRSVDTPYELPRAVQIGLVLKKPDPDDDRRTVDVPFLTTVSLNYAAPVTPRMTLPTDPTVTE